MTINSETRVAGPFEGNDSTTVFPFAFKVFASDELYVVRATDGAETLLALGSDYTVILNPDQNAAPGGTVTLTAPLATGSILTLTSDLEALQPLDLTNQGGFYPRVINNAFDRVTILIQQLKAVVSRTLKFPLSDGPVSDLPGRADRAGRVLAFDPVTSEPVAGPTIYEVETVAASNEAIAIVASNIDDVITVADNISDVTNFADVYYGPSAIDPTTRRDGSALQEGDLYFNTASDRLRVYDGGVWHETPGGSITVQNFSGDGVVTEFQLSYAPQTELVTQVFVAGIYQQKNTYEIGGVDDDILIFSEAPPTGTENIEVVVSSMVSSDDVLRGELASGSGASQIGFVQAGAGAVPRTSQEKMREHVTPEDFGAVGDGLANDTAAFQSALATGKRVLLGATTYRVNLVLTEHFDIEGQGMDRTKLIAFDKTKPVVKNMFQEPKWNYPCISKMALVGGGSVGANEGVGFSFGDFSTYNTGDELIGRVRMTDVYFSNLDKCILKCYGNIGNVFTNVSAYGGNYFYYAQGAQFGNASAGVMHAGADLIVGGQITGIQKMVCLVLDTTVGIGQWTFVGTVFQFNPGGLFYWDVSGTSLTSWQSVSFDNVWIEGNATLASVTIDGLSGPHAVTPSEKFQQTSYGPDYCFWGKTVQHGTTSTLGRVNLWGNERIALNLEGGGIGSGDYVDLAFSSAAYPTVAGAWFRSTRGASIGRNLAIHTATGVSADFNVDGGSTIGATVNTPAVTTTANKLQANVSTGGIVAAFVGPFSGITKINMPDNQSYNAAMAGMHLGSVASTGRSLNASGTLNASGADYAEYMRKSDHCGDIPKGAICGVTREGLLTDVFDSAVSFVVKSTNPAYVGGDTWGHSLEPERYTPEFTAWLAASNALLAIKSAEPVHSPKETDGELAARIAAWNAEVASLTELVAAEPNNRDSDEWTAWDADLEVRRQRVDRIAFSGQVPCNVHGAEPGDYIVPARNADGSIVGQAIKDPTLDQYRRSVGQAWKVLEDGRAWVAVKVS